MSDAYRILPLAQADLFSTWLYLSERAGLEIALRMERRFYRAFEQLAQQPYAGHSRDDLTPLPLRFWSVPPYLVVYRPDPLPIRIMRVLDGRRDLQRILG